MNLILFGFQTSGKTHFGKKLATLLEIPFFDTDSLIEALSTERLSCREIYKRWGKETFRALERKAISSLKKTSASVIAVGGGALADPELAEFLQKRGTLIYLNIDKEALRSRLISCDLPAYLDPADPMGSFEKLYEQRAALYESLPAFTVDVTDRSEEQILEALIQHSLEIHG